MQLRLRRTGLAECCRTVCLLAGLAGWPGLGVGAELSYGFGLEETWTDNVTLSTDDQESELISRITPSMRINSRGRRLSGGLGLTLNSVNYASDSSRNTSYVTLDGSGRYDVRDYLKIDFGGSVSRQYRSSLGNNSIDEVVDPANRDEVKSFYIGPTAPVSFRLGSDVRGTAQISQRTTSDGGGVVGTRRQSTAALDLQGSTGAALVGWGLSYNYRRLGASGGTSARNSRSTRGILSYRARPNLTLRANIGRESNDFRDGENTSTIVRGLGADWVLSSRTRLSATVEKRFFGTGYSYSLAHSRPLSSLSVTYSRDVTTVEDLDLVSLSELAYRDFFIGLVSTIPDPVERDRVARELAASIPNADVVLGGFLTRAALVSRNLRFVGSLIGARNTVSVSVGRRDSERLGSAAGLSPLDDFSRFDTVVSRDFSVSTSHRLSPRESISADYTTSRSEGQGADQEDLTRRSVTLAYNTRFGHRTFANLRYRHQNAHGSRSYRENALIGSLRMNF